MIMSFDWVTIFGSRVSRLRRFLVHLIAVYMQRRLVDAGQKSRKLAASLGPRVGRQIRRPRDVAPIFPTCAIFRFLGWNQSMPQNSAIVGPQMYSNFFAPQSICPKWVSKCWLMGVRILVPESISPKPFDSSIGLPFGRLNRVPPKWGSAFCLLNRFSLLTRFALPPSPSEFPTQGSTLVVSESRSPKRMAVCWALNRFEHVCPPFDFRLQFPTPCNSGKTKVGWFSEMCG